MASWGEGAARGLESGIRLAMGLQQQRRQDERQAADMARQATLDTQAQEDRTRGLSRQALADRAAVQGQREAEQQRLAQVYADTPPDEATRRAFMATGKGLASGRRAIQAELDPTLKDELAAEEAAYDVGAVSKKSEVAAKALMHGDMDLFDQDPDAFRQMVTAKTGFAPVEYQRGPQGEPSRIEQGVADLMEGMDAQDKERTLRGANVVFAPELNKGIGEQSSRGGTIVGKQIVELIPHPGSSRQELRVIPTIRVFVNTGKGDPEAARARAKAKGVELPPGATGFYDAPTTERRSSDPDDPTKAIDVKAALEKAGRHTQLAELINSPQGQYLMELDKASQWDTERFKQAVARWGGKAKPTTTTSSYTLKPGEKRVTETTDAAGNVVSTRATEGNPRTATGSLNATIDAIDEMNLPEAEKERLKKAAITYAATKGKSVAGLASGQGGGEGGSGAGLKERELARKELKDRFDRADKNADNAENAVKTARDKLRDLNAKANSFTYNPRSPEAEADRQRAAELEKEIAEKDALAKKARARASSLSDELDKPESTAPAVKFDKSGNRVGPVVLKFNKNGELVR